MRFLFSSKACKRAEALYFVTPWRAGVWLPEEAGPCGGNGAESGGYDGRQDADDERDPERQTYDGMARIQSIV